MISAELTMSWRLMPVFVFLLHAESFVRSESCPGDCDCTGTFVCDLLNQWSAIGPIPNPGSVNQVALTCNGNGSLGSLIGIEQFISMTVIRIRKCHSLNEIPAGIFKEATELASIDLSGNAIRDVPADSFVGLGKLNTLTLDDNDIHDLPSGTFDDLRQLTSLSLSNNKIASLGTGLFTNTKALVSIDMSLNKLNEIKVDYFGHLPRLKTLILTSNLIRTLAAGSFNIGSLREIYLSSNDIDYIDGSMFASHLEKISASNNHITGVPKGLLTKLNGNLIEFHLGENPFHCNCEIMALVGYIKKNSYKLKGNDMYKCVTPFAATFDEITETNVTCVAPTARPIELDNAANNVICRGTGDPAPVITWTLSKGNEQLVRVFAPRNKTVLRTEAVLPRSAWRADSVHVCRVSTAYGEQQQTFLWHVDIELRNHSVGTESPPKNTVNFTAIVVAVVATFVITLLATAVVTCAIMKRRNVQTAPPSSSFDPAGYSPQTTHANERTDDAIRRVQPHGRKREELRTESISEKTNEPQRGETHNSRHERMPTESVYEDLNDATRDSTRVDPVYTDLPSERN